MARLASTNPDTIDFSENPAHWLGAVTENIALDTDWAKKNRTNVASRRRTSVPLSSVSTPAPAPAPAPEKLKLSAAEKKIPRANGQEYHVRSWGDHDDVAVLRRAREQGLPALLYGEPGTGKTALVEAAFDGSVHTVLGHGDIEVADFIGSYVQHPGGEFVWVDGPLPSAMEAGEPLLIDEIGLIDPKVLSIVYSVMDGRNELDIVQNPERGTVKAQPGFYVVAATNPNAPGVRLSEALLSRFSLQVEVTTDWRLATKLVGTTIPSTVLTAIQSLSKKRQENTISWTPQMREILALKDVTEQFGLEFALQNLLASAPEHDRPTIADVISRALGGEVKRAKI